MTSLEILCARCACHQTTCCQDTDIYLTQQDVARIEQHVGCSGFFEFRRPHDPVYLNEHDDPIWMEKVFRPDGSRRVLKHQPGGDCVFLGARGCTLPAEVRPLVCRLYPYDYNAAGLKPEPASGCPRDLLAPGQSVFEAVGASAEAARRWHAMLYQELQLEPSEPASRRDHAEASGSTRQIGMPLETQAEQNSSGRYPLPRHAGDENWSDL